MFICPTLLLGPGVYPDFLDYLGHDRHMSACVNGDRSVQILAPSLCSRVVRHSGVWFFSSEFRMTQGIENHLYSLQLDNNLGVVCALSMGFFGRLIDGRRVIVTHQVYSRCKQYIDRKAFGKHMFVYSFFGNRDDW